jgi:hypothetical protein
MDEALSYLGVLAPIDEVVATLHRVLPGAVRSNGTRAQRHGTYNHSGPDEKMVTLQRFSDGYGDTICLLIERITDVTYIVTGVAPDDRGLRHKR